MKRVIIQVTLIIIFSATVLAQPVSKEIPAVIANAFSSKYPNTAIKNWRLKDNAYAVKFSADDRTHFAFYGAEGNWLRTETSYGLTQSLPAEVNNGWKHCKFIAWIPQGIKHIQSADSDWYIIRVTNVILYDAEHNEKETYDLFFSPKGELIKKEDRPWRSKDL